MFPVVAGFIAYSISGRPGIVAGFVGGFAAKTGAFSLAYLIEMVTHGLTPLDDPTELMSTLLENSAGFVGAIFAGFLAGVFVKLLKQWFEKLPNVLQGVKDMIFVPLLSVIMIGISMFLINVPLSYMN